MNPEPLLVMGLVLILIALILQHLHQPRKP